MFPLSNLLQTQTNLTGIKGNIKESLIITVGVSWNFPISNHVILCRVVKGKDTSGYIVV